MSQLLQSLATEATVAFIEEVFADNHDAENAERAAEALHAGGIPRHAWPHWIQSGAHY